MPERQEPLSYKPQTLRIRAVLLWGVARRFLLNLLRPGYVRRMRESRKGECARCGVCCHLVANKCGALHLHPDGQSTCRLYTLYRLPNCRTFPIDARDIADRDLVAPSHISCGYRWSDE
jgi:hypothetical protein